MTRAVRAHSRADMLLKELLNGPGTIHQICERAGITADSKVREMFDDLLGGRATITGIKYSITTRARSQLEQATKAPYVGQVAQPRALPAPMPVMVVRRATPGRRA